MNKIYRNQDIVNGVGNLEPLFSLNNFPVFQGCIDQDVGKDLVSDLDFYISTKTGMVQLNPLLPLNIIYQTEHNPGTTGQIWLDHHRAFAKFISKYNPKNVFEIGGSHGILSEYYREYDDTTRWTILEPAPVPNHKLHAKLITGFFTKDTEVDDLVDMIVHSHVLEHIYNPIEFFTSLQRLAIGTRMCFSIPNLELHIREKYTNALSFEHTYFCTEEFVEYWLAKYGFKLMCKHYHNDHSIFYSAYRDETDRLPVPNSYNKNKQLFQEFIDYYKTAINEINKIANDWQGPVYLFGGHIFSQFLLCAGVDESLINCILDNSHLKQNRRLYGTNLMIQNPSILKDIDNPLVILKVGSYTEEIKKDIVNNINSRTQFLE